MNSAKGRTTSSASMDFFRSGTLFSVGFSYIDFDIKGALTGGGGGATEGLVTAGGGGGGALTGLVTFKVEMETWEPKLF